jgi:hypothetical protein
MTVSELANQHLHSAYDLTGKSAIVIPDYSAE